MTAQQLINQALRKIAVLANGETPSTSESDDAFVALNQVLLNWSTQQLPCLGLQRITQSMVGSASYVLSTRPLRIKSANLNVGGVVVEYPVLSAEAFADGKRTQVLYSDGGYPNTTIRLRPAPTSGTLEMDAYVALTAIATLGTAINLPPGYERALVNALAVELAPEYGRTAPPELLAASAESISGIADLQRKVLGEMPIAPPTSA